MIFQSNLLPRSLGLFGDYYGSPVKMEIFFYKLNKCVQGNMGKNKLHEKAVDKNQITVTIYVKVSDMIAL